MTSDDAHELPVFGAGVVDYMPGGHSASAVICELSLVEYRRMSYVYIYSRVFMELVPSATLQAGL